MFIDLENSIYFKWKFRVSFIELCFFFVYNAIHLYYLLCYTLKQCIYDHIYSKWDEVVWQISWPDAVSDFLFCHCRPY